MSRKISAIHRGVASIKMRQLWQQRCCIEVKHRRSTLVALRLKIRICIEWKLQWRVQCCNIVAFVAFRMLRQVRWQHCFTFAFRFWCHDCIVVVVVEKIKWVILRKAGLQCNVYKLYVLWTRVDVLLCIWNAAQPFLHTVKFPPQSFIANLRAHHARTITNQTGYKSSF